MKSLSEPDVKRSVLERIGRLHPGRKARWGRMSAHQMLCHLTDSYRVPMGEKDASSATGPLQRTLVKWVALNVPLHWPKGVPTRPEVEQGVGGTPPVEFERDRDELIQIIQRFSDSPPNFEWRAHPTFGMMRAREWQRWGYLHADHHLRQFGV
jgi:hypothetical protein